MFRIIPFLLSVVVALAVLADPSSASSGRVCHEDQRCFNWTADGNGARGVILRNGRTIVVGPCAFQRRWYGVGTGSRIDRARTPNLKGDRWARRHGCGFDVMAA